MMIAISTTIPLAHAGHWAAGLLYLMPVFILGGGIWWQRRNDRLEEESGDGKTEEEVPFTDE